MKKYAFLLLILSSCMVPPQYQDQYYLGDRVNHNTMQRRYTTYGCVENPYIYHADTYNWQLWECRNYNVSCNRYRTGY